MTVLGPEHLDDPVGLHMRREVWPLGAEQTVDEALQSLRTHELAEKIVYFYVVDSGGILVGVVPTRRLLMSDPGTAIASIMVDRVIAIPSSASVLTACEFFILHRLLGFPVVDDAGRLLGTVDVSLFTDEVLGLAEKRSAESAFQIIGVHVALGRARNPLAGFRDRFPWLLCNIAGGIACALLAGLYALTLERALVLALFMPVTLALSESVSIQSMTITLQSLQQGRVNWRLLVWTLGREFPVAILLGAASAALVAGVCGLWKGFGPLCAAMMLSILLGMVTACLLGVAVPSAVRALRRDPKIAAGPVVLATADVATLFFYLGVASMVLQA